MTNLPFMDQLIPVKREQLLKQALGLAMVSVGYNILEGLVSVFFGLEDETLALFGFGLDSFVEVVSGMGIWHMVRRLQHIPDEHPDRFEQTALRITGFSFYTLTLGLTATAAYSLYAGHRPETTTWGIVISLISMATMWLLLSLKLKVGRALNSQAIVADAHCTRACLALSVVLLASSLLYEFTTIGGMDALGALGIAWFCWREGRESLEKAKGKTCSCGSGPGCNR